MPVFVVVVVVVAMVVLVVADLAPVLVLVDVSQQKKMLPVLMHDAAVPLCSPNWRYLVWVPAQSYYVLHS